ncbi:MAG: fibronectin type III domain-containing protein [Leadbetterella sp.]
MKKYLVVTCLLLIRYIAFSQLPPGAPSSLAVCQDGLNSGLNVSWTPSISPSAIGYYVFYKPKTSTGAFTRVRVLGGTATGTTLGGLQADREYSVYATSFRIGTLPTDTLQSTTTTSTVDALLISLFAPPISNVDANATSNQLTINIADQNIFEDGFIIEYSANGGAPQTKTVATNGQANYAVPLDGLNPRTSYSIRVRAKRGGGCNGDRLGPWSSSISGVTRVGAPPAPQLSESGNCPTFAAMRWTIPSRPEDIEYFIIERSTDNSNYVVYVNNYPAASRDYTDNGVTPGVNFFYRIRSVNATANQVSNTINVGVKNYINPNPATNLISDNLLKTDKTVTIRWTNGAVDNDCRTNFRDENVVFYRLDRTGDFKILERLPADASSIKISNLKAKQKVEVFVNSVSNRGLIGTSATILDSTYGPPNAPLSPTFVQGRTAAGNDFFHINWRKGQASEEDLFQIERSTRREDGYALLGIIDARLFTEGFKDLTIENGVIYYYRIRAANYIFGPGAYSTIVGPCIFDATAKPNAPYALLAKENAGKVDLKWVDDSSSEEKYVIEKSSDAGATFAVVATLTKNIEKYTDENVSPGRSYVYRVKAENTVGSSGFSNLADIKLSGGASTLGKEDGYAVYPNPASEHLVISSEDAVSLKNAKVSVYSNTNALLISDKVDFNTQGEGSLSIQRLLPGVYYLLIEADGKTIRKRIVKF